jgi:HEAT repeat protein
MQNQTLTRSAAAAATVLGATAALADDKPKVDQAALEKSFEALKSYDWGTDYKKNDKHEDMKYQDVLGAIDNAVPATHDNEALRKELEAKLAAVLPTGASRAAKDYVGRKLAVVGSAASVPALAALLPDKDLSHMARYALERIPAPEAGKALRDALSKTNGGEKAGVIGSLGVRRDAACVADIAGLVDDSDQSIGLAAATALGDIGTVDAAKALEEAKPASTHVKMRVADARLTVGERLLAAGDKAGAMAVYKSLIGSEAKNVKLAATRGLLLASGKKE